MMSRLLLGFAMLTVLVMPALANDSTPLRQISLTGEGKVDMAPDMAMVTTGVRTHGETARDALSANNVAMANLIEELTAAGIFERDIQTSNFSVQPRYVHSNERDGSGYTRPPRIDGYDVSNDVFIRVRDLDALGPVLDRAVTVGANTIGGISFSLSDPQKAQNEARKQAFANAQAKAELYAEAGGFVLGDVLTVSEQFRGAQPPRPMAQEAMRMSMDMAASVPVQSGEVSTTVTVNVTWQLQ